MYSLDITNDLPIQDANIRCLTFATASQAGIQCDSPDFWIPAFAGMTISLVATVPWRFASARWRWFGRRVGDANAVVLAAAAVLPSLSSSGASTLSMRRNACAAAARRISGVKGALFDVRRQKVARRGPPLTPEIRRATAIRRFPASCANRPPARASARSCVGSPRTSQRNRLDQRRGPEKPDASTAPDRFRPATAPNRTFLTSPTFRPYGHTSANSSRTGAVACTSRPVPKSTSAATSNVSPCAWHHPTISSTFGRRHRSPASAGFACT